MVVVKGEREENRESKFNGYRVSVGERKRVLETNG